MTASYSESFSPSWLSISSYWLFFSSSGLINYSSVQWISDSLRFVPAKSAVIIFCTLYLNSFFSIACALSASRRASGLQQNLKQGYLCTFLWSPASKILSRSFNSLHFFRMASSIAFMSKWLWSVIESRMSILVSESTYCWICFLMSNSGWLKKSLRSTHVWKELLVNVGSSDELLIYFADSN